MAKPGHTSHEMGVSLRIGVSSCLLGNQVRYDGGHQRDRFLTDVLGPWVEWVPVCPEVEVGMGVPRETVRLVEDGGQVRMIAEKSGTDHTRSMESWAAKRVRELTRQDLSAYVLKKNSPSCGMEKVKVYRAGATPRRNGGGMFAQALLDRVEGLPVEEEGRLHDPPLRENFIERMFAYRRVRKLFSGRWTRAHVVTFHPGHKMQLLAHSEPDYRALGRIVAAVKDTPRALFAEHYQRGFMRTLVKIATRKRQVKVLEHMTGDLRESLDAASRAELRDAIRDYGAGLVPILVPVTLIRHHVRLHGVECWSGRTYLEPHPKELMLRNHV